MNFAEQTFTSAAGIGDILIDMSTMPFGSKPSSGHWDDDDV